MAKERPTSAIRLGRAVLGIARRSVQLSLAWIVAAVSGVVVGYALDEGLAGTRRPVFWVVTIAAGLFGSAFVLSGANDRRQD